MTKRPKRPRGNVDTLPTPAGGRLRSVLAETPLHPETQRAAHRGLGSAAGGQSGDTAGLPVEERAAPESVEALVEEGQDYEAELVAGVEEAPEADQGDVRTHRYVPPESPWREA